MHLINTKSLELEYFSASRIPRYAILSHTWQDEEVLFEDMMGGETALLRAKSRKGWQKIVGSCEQARAQDLAYIWIDTCCIDKSSSAELSEAINSMFHWYQSAETCLAYLSDVTCPGELSDTTDYIEFRHSRWFTRGWTLQELIAPQIVCFYGHEWQYVGSKSGLCNVIAGITGIDRQILDDPSLLSQASVAQRMSWAATRQTERPEDIAYCLLGVFDINMPLIYGEGMKAFVRLQEEILKQFEDYSIFAWSLSISEARLAWVTQHALKEKGVLALHPICFQYSGKFVPYQAPDAEIISTPRGIRLRAVSVEAPCNGSMLLALFCYSFAIPDQILCIRLDGDRGSGKWYRDPRHLSHIEYKEFLSGKVSNFLLHKNGRNFTSDRSFLTPVSIGREAPGLRLLDAKVLRSPKFSVHPLEQTVASIAMDRIALDAVEEYLTWNLSTQVCLFPDYHALRYTWLVMEDQSTSSQILILARLCQKNPSLMVFHAPDRWTFKARLTGWIKEDLTAYYAYPNRPVWTSPCVVQGRQGRQYYQSTIELAQSSGLRRTGYIIHIERSNEYVPRALLYDIPTQAELIHQSCRERDDRVEELECFEHRSSNDSRNLSLCFRCLCVRRPFHTDDD